MRIISGELKGKKLSEPLDKSTRPLRDMVRESIFNILDHSNKLSTTVYKIIASSFFFASSRIFKIWFLVLVKEKWYKLCSKFSN